jgi:hypothetical protein
VIAGFILTDNTTSCRECPRALEKTLKIEIARIVRAEEAAGRACALCGKSLVAGVTPWKPTMVGLRSNPRA